MGLTENIVPPNESWKKSSALRCLLQGLRLAGCLLLRPLRRGRGGHGETHGLHGLQLFAFACGATGATSTFGTEAGRL